MNYLLTLVKKFLQDAAEFYPVGAFMNIDGKMNSMAGYDGRENPPSDEIIQIITQGFIEGAKDGSFKATALAYDALVTDPDTGSKDDAIAIALDHRQNYSVVVHFRYRMHQGLPILEPPTASPGARQIFR